MNCVWASFILETSYYIFWSLSTQERYGLVVGGMLADRDELLIVTQQGQIIHMTAGGLRPIGRDTQGVRLMDLADGDRVVSIAALSEPEEVQDQTPPEAARLSQGVTLLPESNGP